MPKDARGNREISLITALCTRRTCLPVLLQLSRVNFVLLLYQPVAMQSSALHEQAGALISNFSTFVPKLPV